MTIFARDEKGSTLHRLRLLAVSKLSNRGEENIQVKRFAKTRKLTLFHPVLELFATCTQDKCGKTMKTVGGTKLVVQLEAVHLA